MHPYIDGLFSPAALEGTFAPIPCHAALDEYDREIIRRTQQAIQRSRQLLQSTKHQVSPPADLGSALNIGPGDHAHCGIASMRRSGWAK
jgi:hypothetical protein